MDSMHSMAYAYYGRMYIIHTVIVASIHTTTVLPSTLVATTHTVCIIRIHTTSIILVRVRARTRSMYVCMLGARTPPRNSDSDWLTR